MSLRDFNNAPFSDDPTALHTAPSGNGAGLESFHTVQPEDIEPNNMPKIIGAAAVALMVGVAGMALYAHSGSQPKPVVAASNLPPAEPVQQTAMASDANTPPPAAETPAPATAMSPAEKMPAPIKSASIAKKPMASKSSESASADSSSAAATRLSADSSQSTVQPQQQPAVTPQPSPSDVAANNTQSGVAVPPGANTASDIPAAPPALQQPAPAANPAPEQQPAPTQPSGQAAQ